MLVLIALEGEDAAAIRDRLIAWSAAHVLRPFCWWEASPGLVHANVLAVRDGQVSEERLTDAVAGEFAGAAVVVPLALGAIAPETLVADLEPYVAALNVAVPPVRGRPVRPALIAIASTIGAAVPADLFSLAWGGNVYVAAEDRKRQADRRARADELPPDPRMGANRLADHPERFTGHAAHAVAAITGLWAAPAALGTNQLEVIARRQPNSLPVQVQLARCFTDVVDFGYVSDQLAARVFKPGRAWPNPDPKRFTETGNPDPVLRRLTTGFYGKHQDVIGLTRFVPIELDPPVELGILQALAVLWQEFWFRIKQKPLDLAEAFARTVVNRVADRVEQLGGRGRTWTVNRWDKRQPEQRSLEDLIKELDRAVVPPDGAFSVAWRDLRAMSLGLIDGAELPEGVDREQLAGRERRTVITDPRRIVPHPELKPTPTEIRPRTYACDPLHLDPEFVGSPAVIGETTALEQDQLDEFRRSFLWMVGTQLARSLHRATREAEPPVGASTDVDELSEAELAKRRKRRRRRLLLKSFMALLIAIGAIVVEAFALEPKFAAPAAVVTWLVLLVTLWRLARTAMRRADSEERARIEERLARVNAALERSLREGDAERLRRRYGEFLKWSATLGHVVHSPWIGDPQSGEPLATHLREEQLPAALDRRVPADAEGALKQLTGSTRARVFEPGWLDGLYGDVERAAMVLLGLAHDYIPDELQHADLPDPAGDDDNLDEGAPLNALVRFVESGESRRLSQNPLSKELLRYVGSLPIDALSRRVLSAEEVARTATAEGVGALPPSVALFDAPEGLGELGKAIAPSVVLLLAEGGGQTHGGTGFVVDDQGVIATARHVVEGAEVLTAIFADGQESPVTVERVAAHTDVALVRCPSRSGLASLPLRAEPAVLGELVVTAGHPRLLRGDSTLSWGLVSAERRIINLGRAMTGVADVEVFQASFPAAGGASGSPVVDAAGAVVGVVVALATVDGPQDEYMSFVVPVRDLEALLAGDGHDGGEVQSTKRLLGTPAEGGVAPSAFFSPREVRDRLLNVEHWDDPTGRTQIEDVLPAGVDAIDRDTPISAQTTKIAFRAPLVVVSSRCQLAPLAPADAIAGVTGSPQAEPQLAAEAPDDLY